MFPLWEHTLTEHTDKGIYMEHTTDQRTQEIRFFWNGIKVGTGKLQKAYYYGGEHIKSPAGTITISSKGSYFSDEIAAVFKVENNTDMMTDYFENDRIRVAPDHPLYAKVKAALEAKEAHYAKRRGV